MKKIMQFLILLIPLVLSCADQVDHIDRITQTLEPLIVLEISKGDFFPGDKESYVAFCENPDWRYGNKIPNVDEVKIITIEPSGKIEISELFFESLGYSSYDHELIDKLKTNIPNWDNLFSVFDFNGNGRDEVFSIASSGIGLLLYIYEYDGNSFSLILDDSEFLGIKIKDIKYVRDEKGIGFQVIRIFNDNGNSREVKQNYFWNLTEGRYLISE